MIAFQIRESCRKDRNWAQLWSVYWQLPLVHVKLRSNLLTSDVRATRRIIIIFGAEKRRSNMPSWIASGGDFSFRQLRALKTHKRNGQAHRTDESERRGGKTSRKLIIKRRNRAPPRRNSQCVYGEDGQIGHQHGSKNEATTHSSTHETVEDGHLETSSIPTREHIRYTN